MRGLYRNSLANRKKAGRNSFYVKKIKSLIGTEIIFAEFSWCSCAPNKGAGPRLASQKMAAEVFWSGKTWCVAAVLITAVLVNMALTTLFRPTQLAKIRHRT